ncbi:phage portal protein [Microbacterium sp. 22242]|uniref:phage portal protein n=1 Tax=Microbacterium sp. 22242 TaxID=3453896 RepID=UPI003F834E9F
MPLPASNFDQWPPKQLDNLLPAMARWGAWWANDLGRLQAVYGGGILNDGQGFFASDQGGIKVHSLGPVRWFIGQPATGAQQNTKLPVPMAAEICQASADLLFADPVTVTVGDQATQDRLETLLDDTFHSKMAEAAEMSAALGGSYLRVTWDDTLQPDGPFTTVKDADEAIPEFRFGVLTAVTFWAVIARNGKRVYRHLERHELGAVGNGVILHGLYEGEEDKLGVRIGLGFRQETASLANYMDLGLEGTIDTKSPGLAVQYVPNQTPNRLWRKDPIGKNLGRSDLDGIEHLLDQLSETMSDWMRARRAARARVFMAKELAKTMGPGQAAVVQLDQETYVETGMSGSSGEKPMSMADRVQVLQPAFEPVGYKETVDMLIEQILQMSGYSLSTFGVNQENRGDKTATEIEARERRSLMTRARKIRIWKPVLLAHVAKLLEVDRVFFAKPNKTTDLAVEFSDGVQESQLRLAQTVQALYAAESASVEERVSILHPDWDEQQISDEVARIRAEFAHPVPDPQMSPFDQPTDPGAADGNAGPVG